MVATNEMLKTALESLRNYLRWIHDNEELVNNEAVRKDLINTMMENFTRFSGGMIFKEYCEPSSWGINYLNFIQTILKRPMLTGPIGYYKLFRKENSF